MSNLRCIIIEDEPLAAKVLTDYVKQVPFLELQAIFKDAILATAFLRDHHIELMFLDIHLPKLKGMAFLKTLPDPPAVIVTTAYHQYAVEGFDLNVTDYLLKPFSFERFLVGVNKVKAGHRELSQPKETTATKEYLILSVQKKKVRILFSDIIYAESQREYVKIATVKGDYLSKISTHEIESLLPAKNFRRIHRSFIISISRIDSYNAEMVDVGGVSLPIGRAYKDVLDAL